MPEFRLIVSHESLEKAPGYTREHISEPER